MTEHISNVQREKAIEEFNRLHSTMFSEISSMLKEAKLAPMLTLRAKNPTFSSLVIELINYRQIYVAIAQILDLDKEDEIGMISEYLALADDLAKAIDADDADALCGAIAALDVKPYI
ncbi:TPA: hypothetical protein ACGAHI_001294 [Yersinia enterocolitica]|nr:Uncharacterised protein [Yersinia intermedia]HDL8497028.1 hypothetical protein [Yersinia enterocolitica]HDM8386553.1 hypothetical protein [Yersinia enterocolitica]